MPTTVQAFPRKGVLAKNLDCSVSRLKRRIGKYKAQDAAYSYVVTSIVLDRENLLFEQHGSAPNFQGDRLTICTCKHQMRTNLDGSQWRNKWIAGFTSRTLYGGRHWLFFLTRVADAHESHFDLWSNLPAVVRNSKSAESHFLGDVFAPRDNLVGEDRFRFRNYFAPSHHTHRKHKCDNGWHNDIQYKHSRRRGRHPALLVGDPKFTFIWTAPKVFNDEDHCRNFRKWGEMDELLEHFQQE